MKEPREKIRKRNIFSIIFQVSKTALFAWWAKEPFRQSAVIAYYAIFSLPGLLLVIITLAGYFFGREAANGQVSEQITAMLGSETSKQVQTIIVYSSESKNSLIASIIGIGTMIFAATGVFGQFQHSLNMVWEVELKATKSGFLNLLKVRLFSFGLIIAMAFILMVSLVISALLSAFGNWLSGHFSESVLVVMIVINVLLSFLILTVLFALMFKIFPDAHIKWRYVWIGSFVTSFLFEIGKFGLGLYFGKLNPGIGYGAAGSMILILLWVSYSSMIVFYGAEFTRAYAEVYTEKVLPSKIAKVKRQPKS
jgi:membrane protein